MDRVNYNNLEDIDRLIEKLEREMPSNTSSNSKINKAIERRKEQINELKKISRAAKQQEEDERILRKLEKENDSIDEVIAGMKKWVNKTVNTNSVQSYCFESRVGESNCGCYESRTYSYKNNHDCGYGSESRASESR